MAIHVAYRRYRPHLTAYESSHKTGMVQHNTRQAHPKRVSSFLVPDHLTIIFFFPTMASSAKLTALATFLAVAVAAAIVAAAPTATTPGYSGGGGTGAVTPPVPESCDKQIMYFTNCLARYEIRGQCCSVVESSACLCQLKREVTLPCKLHRHHERKCSKERPEKTPPVKLAELQQLPCFKTLKC